MSDSNTPEQQGSRIPFPSNQPRVWFLTAGCNPTAASIARHLLEHGDSVVAGIHPSEHFSTGSHKEDFGQLLSDVSSNQEWKARLRVIRFDFRHVFWTRWRTTPRLTRSSCSSVAECQSATAEAEEAFGHIDVLLLCSSEALFGTIEELGQSSRTQSLVTDQFATNFFGPVNIIKAHLPILRAQRSGHIVLLTGISKDMQVTPGKHD